MNRQIETAVKRDCCEANLVSAGMMNRILIVEDELHLAEGLRFNLEAEGYRVDVITDGTAALNTLLSNAAQYDVLVLDVMLPGRNGFEVAAELRAAGIFLPILMLTARNRPEDVLRGFESGADDYLPKPFDLAILFARIKGLLRRHDWLRQDQERASVKAAATVNDVFKFDHRTIDFAALELRTPERTVQLTLMEAKLLKHLIANAGKAVSRREILEDVWDLHEDTDTRAIDNFIVRLRKYLEDDPAKPRHLLTVRGIGYRFIAEPR